MTMLYQPVAIALRGQGRNNGLRTILEEIGKNEYRIMENRAICEGRDSFYFPSGHIHKSQKVLCMVGHNNHVSNDMYYEQGVYRINKKAAMGAMNKTAIRRLVDATTNKGKDGNGDPGIYKYYYLHRLKTERIFAAIHQYIESEFLPIDQIGVTQGRYMMIQTKRKVYGDGVPRRSGADIVATPYYMEIEVSYRTFIGRERILYQIRTFNSFTGKDGVM